MALAAPSLYLSSPCRYGRPRRVTRLLSLTGGWTETSLCVFAQCVFVLLALLAIQLPLRLRCLRRNHLPPTRREQVHADRNPSKIPEDLEAFFGGCCSSCNSSLLPSAHLCSAAWFRRRGQSDSASCRCLQELLPVDLFGAGMGVGVPDMAPSPRRTPPSPAVLVDPGATRPAVCREWIWIPTFPPPPQLHTLSKTGKFLAVLRRMTATKVFLMKYSNY